MAEARLRVYVDTSVIGGCHDVKFELPSRRLFARFRAGEFVLIVSDVTVAELGNAPAAVRDVLRQVPQEYIELWPLTPEAERLAEAYLREGVIPRKMWSDAQHIAVATLARVDVLVSWNFKHIVNFQRIRGYNAVNAELGYPPVEIRTPQEVDGNDD